MRGHDGQLTLATTACASSGYSGHEASRVAEEAVSHLQPDLLHFYLGAVGTATASQRQGLGAAVLGPYLDAPAPCGTVVTRPIPLASGNG